MHTTSQTAKHTMSQAATSRLQSEPLARTILHHLCQFLHAEPGSHLDLTGLQGGTETVAITARFPVSLYRHLEAFDAFEFPSVGGHEGRRGGAGKAAASGNFSARWRAISVVSTSAPGQTASISLSSSSSLGRLAPKS